MRSIADGAGTAVGLAYRYFPSKDAIVFELYQRQAAEFETIVDNLPAGALGQRFADAMEQRLALLSRHRSALAGLLVASLDPQSQVGVLSGSTQPVRERVGRTLLTLVQGSKAAPSGPVARDVADLLYVAHLAILLFWLSDRTRDASATHRLMRLVARVLDGSSMLLATPFARTALRELTSILEPVFHPKAEEQ